MAVEFGWRVVRRASLPSTQDFARARLDIEGIAAVGLVVVAAAQTAGRGRQGRIWHAPPGANLSLTAIGPPVLLKAAWQLALVAGVAVAEALESGTEPAPRLKFPNDVVLNQRKVAGILIETCPAPSPDRVFPLIGIGVNVRRAARPAALQSSAVSLEEVRPNDCPSVGEIETAVLRRLTHRWQEWQENGFDQTLAAWRGYHDVGDPRTFVLENGQTVIGRLQAIEGDGTAIVITESSAVHCVPGSLAVQ